MPAQSISQVLSLCDSASLKQEDFDQTNKTDEAKQTNCCYANFLNRWL